MKNINVRFIHGSPMLVGKGQYGIWRVTAHFTDGRIHSKDYEASSIAHAKRCYLMEFGTVRGTLHAEFQKKGIDKWFNL